MLLKLFIITQAISLVFSSSSLRLKEIEDLIDKFNSELDINYLFYDKVREQKGNPLLCSSELGPHCNLINGQSLLDKVDYTNDTLDIQLRKAAIVRDWDQIHLQEQSTGSFYVVSNKHDVNLGRENKKTALPDKVEALITFEQIPTSPKETLISNSLLYKYNRDFQLDTVGTISKSSNDDDLKISFEKLYAPEESQVYNKKSLHDAQEVANKKETELKEVEPTELYIYTKKDEEGVLHFSRPIIIQQIYARKHNYLQYENERKAQGKSSTHVEHTFKGLYLGNNAIEFNGNSFSNVNKWTRVIPKSKNVAIDSLVITANTDIDNILFTIAKPEVHKAGLSAEDLQDVYQFLSSRLTQYETITDHEDLIKMMKKDVEVHLKEKNVDKDIIAKVIGSIQLIGDGEGQYTIMISDSFDLLDLPAGVEVLQMSELLGSDPEKLEEIKAQILKELAKKGLTEEDVRRELSVLLGGETATAPTKKGDEKKKSEAGESRIKKD